MGVQLKDIIEKEYIGLRELRKRILAIDAFNMLYQFLASIRQPDGSLLTDSDGTITSHISGLFYRTARLMENGIKPVFIFDGEHPKFKSETEKERANRKKDAYEKWKQAIELGKQDEILKYAQQTGRLTKDMISDAKDLLNAMGIPYVDAPSEGEAQAAVMAMKGIAYASASQDYDSLLFGSPKLIRNISITGKRKIPRTNRYKLIEPERINLDDNLRRLGINREQLIIIGILVGTDFNNGVRGVGPKTALKIVKEYKTLDAAIMYVTDKYAHKFEEYIEDVYGFFLNPPYTDPKISFRNVDREAVIKFLCERHEFDEERVVKTVDKIIKAHEEIFGQSSISDWF